MALSVFASYDHIHLPDEALMAGISYVSKFCVFFRKETGLMFLPRAKLALRKEKALSSESA